MTSAQILSFIYLLVNLAATILAWRNFRLRRSDRSGALRVALYFFALGFLISLIHVHHTLGPAEGGAFDSSLAQASVRAILFWLWYTALEPYVRRLWPQTLISWARLLEGRWHDALVGRDLLTGTLFGLALNLADQLRILAPRWLGLTLPPFITSPSWTLEGLGGLVADCFYKQIDAVFLALFCLMFLLLLRFAFRGMVLASLGFILVLTTLRVLGSEVPSAIEWLAWSLRCGLILWALIRFGLLAAVIALLTANLLTFPITTHLSAWYASHGLAGLGLVLALASFGFYTSKGTQLPLRV
jgi:hypothetical protein